MSGRRQNNQPEQLGLALVPGSRSEAPDDRRTRARTARGEARVRIAPKALQRFKLRVRELTRRTGGISLKQMVTELACEDGTAISASAKPRVFCNTLISGYGAECERLPRASHVSTSASTQPAEPPDADPARPVVWQGRAGNRAPYADRSA
jgi:hypothetical protein